MNTNTHQSETLPKWIMIIVIALIATGIFIRFYDLDGKFFWGDEVNTLLYTAGFTKAELIADISDKEIEVGYLNKYIFSNPEKSFTDTVKAISVDETQHPPLYYALSGIWLKIFGNSIWVIRSFSVLMGLLAFPCIYWLSRELFESKKVAWLAVAVLAVSPFHLIYAQEARLYSMWSLITLLSSAVLLRALSRRSNLWWMLYGASILVGLYTFTLFTLVVPAHGAYVLLINLRQIKISPLRIPYDLLSYAISTAVAIILFLPWAYLLIKNLSRAQSNLGWMNLDIGIPALLQLWAFNLSSAFLDIGLVPKIPLPIELPLTSVEFMNSPHLDQILASYQFLAPVYFILKLLILILILYSILFIIRHANKRTSLFLLTLIVIPFIGITFRDLISGGVGSTIVGYRFFVPVIIGIELTVVFLLASKIAEGGKLPQRLWQFFTIVILFFGLASCITYFKADTWWTLRYGYHVTRIAPIINSADHPIVVTKFESQILAFPHHLDPNTRLLMVSDIEKFKLPDTKGDIFIYDLTTEMKEVIDKSDNLEIEEVNANDRLWRLKKIE